MIDIVVFAFIMTAVIRVLVAMWRTWAHNGVVPSSFETSVSAHPYHCVAIHHQAGACAAVKRVSGQRFLSKEAPPIPLPACDAASCRCRYLHFEDRRRNGERRNPQPYPLADQGAH